MSYLDLLKESQQIQERYLLSDHTISIDLDKFESGESRKLVIAGLSGAGKSTLGRYLAEKYKCHLNVLDECCGKLLGKDGMKKWDNRKKDGTEVEFFKLFYNKCFKPVMLSHKREILEGPLFQAYMFFPESRSLILKQPVIILGKSIIKASLDRTLRSFRKEKYKDATLKQKIDKFKQGLTTNAGIQKHIDFFKKDRIKSGNIEKFDVPRLF